MLTDAGFELLNDAFFNEFTIRVKGGAAQLVEKLASDGILAGVPASRLLPARASTISSSLPAPK